MIIKKKKKMCKLTDLLFRINEVFALALLAATTSLNLHENERIARESAAGNG